jgi:multidrug resistance efflux pump
VEPSENRAENKLAEKQPVAAEARRSARRERPLTPVRTPWSVRWREFRVSVLPLTVFSAGVAVAAICWQQVGTSTGVAGIGEGIRSTVSSPLPARLHQLLVRPYQLVQAGDAVAVIVPTDPRIELDLLQTELDLARLQLQPSIAEENAMNFEQIRVDLWRTKAELAVAKVNRERAENQVRRNEPLFREKLVSEDIYDLSAKTRDMYAVEVFEKSNAVAQIEKRVAELEGLGLPQTGATNSLLFATLARLRALQTAAASNWAPITLRAPLSGMITSVSRRHGENVIEGEPLIGISSLHSERVVGYLRQPYPLEPDVGMEVTMTTRERKPRKFSGVLTEIGAHVEIITNALAFVRPGSLVDAGLPLIVSLPDAVQIRPGEIVDISFRTPRLNPAAPGRAREQQALMR